MGLGADIRSAVAGAKTAFTDILEAVVLVRRYGESGETRSDLTAIVTVTGDGEAGDTPAESADTFNGQEFLFLEHVDVEVAKDVIEHHGRQYVVRKVSGTLGGDAERFTTKVEASG